jgi:tRNA G10  N-methylase Trm11
MPEYIFQFGNTPTLSRAELGAVLSREQIGQDRVQNVADNLSQITLEDDQRAQALLDLLGGTIKVTRVIKKLEDSSPQALGEAIFSHLNDLESKPHFGVAEWGRDHLPKIDPAAIKIQLVKAGKSARYVEGTRSGLSASVLLHHANITEVVAIQTYDELLLTETVAVQNIDEWSKRDREKPYADRKKGMLPPKVARMMVNLALQHLPTKDTQPVLLDPFCGTGTILAEGLMLDCNVVGSDLDDEAVTGTQKNLEWLQAEFATTGEFRTLTADATKLSLSSQVNMIVSEPFLGKPKPNPDKLASIFRGLEKLYLGSFRHWSSLLKPGSPVVIILPRVVESKPGKTDRTYSMTGLIDRLAGLGYTTVSDPIIYHRPQAVVQREVHQFQFVGK